MSRLSMISSVSSDDNSLKFLFSMNMFHDGSKFVTFLITASFSSGMSLRLMPYALSISSAVSSC